MVNASDNGPVHFNDTETVAYLPTVKAVVSMVGIGYPALKPTRSFSAAQPTEPTVLRMYTPGDSDVAYWGSGNDFPQQVIQLASQSTIIPQALADKAALWIGGGLLVTENEDSEEWVNDPEIKAFVRSITTKRYLLEATLDIAWWMNAFPEFILSKDRSVITQLHNNETAYCRWGRMNPLTGALDRVFINANWPQARALSPETILISAINPYRIDRVDAVRSGSEYKYIYPLSFPSPGRSYYQLAAWDSVRSSGWLEVLTAIPQFKKFGLQNQMTLKYHIQVPAEYWKQAYGAEWEADGGKNQRTIRDGFLSDMMDKLTDVKNTNKGIMTTKILDRQGKETGIVIEVLDDKQTEGKYNLDYSEGVANLLYALGVDPTLFGFAGKDMGTRSGGSDKREAFWIFLSKSKPYRDRILEPLDFVAEYNGWKDRWPDLTFKFRDTLLTTLDTGKSTAAVKTPA